MVEVGLPRNSGRLEVERGGRKVWETLLFACASPQALKRIQDFWLLLSLSIYLSAFSLLVTAGDCQAARRAYLFVPGIRGSSKKWL